MCDDGGDDISTDDDISAGGEGGGLPYDGSSDIWATPYGDYSSSSGAGWILFGILMFIGAAIALWIALVALTIHSAVKAIIAWQEQRYISAALWGSLFVVLVSAWVAGNSQ